MINSVKKSLLAAAVASSAIALSAPAHAVSVEVGDGSLDIYGYARLDVNYDVDAKLGNSIVQENIYLDGAERAEGHVDMHANQSRLGFRTSLPSGGEPVKVVVETDFYGGGGGQLRLRHAYGEWNGILAGQTWSNFTSLLAVTPTVDFTGPPGDGNRGRNAQLRYTTGGLNIAIEDPDAWGGVVAAGGDHRSGFPDLSARYLGKAAGLRYSVAGVYRYLAYDDGQNSDESHGWGANLELSYAASESLTLRAGGAYGEGMGGYVQLARAEPAYVNAQGDVDLVKGFGATVGATLKVSGGMFNLVYGVADADLDDAVASGAVASNRISKMESTYLNYMWFPAKNVTYGAEIGLHEKEEASGADGSAVRVQFMAQYGF